MPVPARRAGESASKYRQRLVDFFLNEGRPLNEALGAAYAVARRGRKRKKAK